MNGKVLFKRIAALSLMAIACAIANAETPVEKCDQDKDRRISEAEMETCLLAPKLAELEKKTTEAKKKAKDRAAEAIILWEDDTPQDQKGTISLKQAEEYIRLQAAAAAEPADLKFGWSSLEIGRKLTDAVAVDPKKKKLPVPFIVSFTKDIEKKSDALILIGDINWVAWSIGDTAAIKWASSVDLTTAKAASESSIGTSLTIAKEWDFENEVLSNLTLSIEPKYTTDRKFDRDVVQLTTALTPSSWQLLRAGYTDRVGPSRTTYEEEYRLYWQPVFSFEYGDVKDAAGNADLQAIKDLGKYKRVAASAELVLGWPTRYGISWNASYTHRHDLDQKWDREMFTTGFQYVVAKNFFVTLTYRNGRKPDKFERIEDILFGIGFSK